MSAFPGLTKDNVKYLTDAELLKYRQMVKDELQKRRQKLAVLEKEQHSVFAVTEFTEDNVKNLPKAEIKKEKDR